MSDSGRKDEGGDITRVDRPAAANRKEVDRTASTVMVPKSGVSSDFAVEGVPLSRRNPSFEDDASESFAPTPSSRAVNSFRFASQSSGSGPTRQPNSLRSRAFPVTGWGKYEHVDFIGEGGMGRVYKVRDPVLQRQLALKFIRDEDDRLIRRFLQEAQAQARIEHEHVCKVYEVGEVEGLPYIAMQYIDGKSLKESIHELSLEQKVMVIRQVALALSAAHRMGIIHRDIKPSNIMLEKKEDGSYHPYVMDFGLAREMASPGESMAGIIEGTPSYMAPEQARGDHKLIDRRADIYSLGATLYQQLAERPPFVGDSSLSVLMAVDKEDAAPLRKLVPSIPEDLDIIVMKCIEKDPSRRYESAKALADDLERYLAGEPIVARKASLSYLLLKKIRKHRAVFAVSCVGLIGITVAGAYGIRVRLEAAEQAELSKQVGEDVKEMEYLLRWAYGLPLHNLSREKGRIRERMKEIEGRIEKMGPVGEGPGHYALGRGYLALHEPERAREHLEKALLAGYGGGEVERALGKAMGEIYRKELEETNRIGDSKPREAKRLVIEKELLEPALEHLRRGGGEDLESGALLEGVIAFYQKRYETALEKAKESEEKALSTYEALKLRADVYSALGTGKKEKGKGEEALLDYERAAAAYEAARGIARSDAAVYEAECEMWVQRMEVELNSGKNPKASFEKAMGACEGALTIHPESGAGHGRKAWSLWMYGSYLGGNGQDPQDVLRGAIRAAEVAATIEPNNANHLDTIGNAYSAIGLYEMGHGKDPLSSFRLAAENLEKAIVLHPNFAWAHNDLGIVYRRLGAYQSSRGVDPSEALKKSIKFREKAVSLDPSYYYPYTNMGMTYVTQAQYDLRYGHDPSESLRLAIQACEKSLTMNQSYFITHDVLGLVYLVEAQLKMYRQEPIVTSVQQALQSFRLEFKANPDVYDSHLGMTMGYVLLATEALTHGKDAADHIKNAEFALQEAEKTGGEDPLVPLYRAKLALIRARHLMAMPERTPKDLEKAFLDAESTFLAAKKVGADIWEVFEAGAELSFWHALYARREKKKDAIVGEIIRAGSERVAKGLSISPQEPSLLAWKAAFLLLSSRLSGGKETQEDKEGGRRLMEEALQKNPFLRPFWTHTEALILKE